MKYLLYFGISWLTNKRQKLRLLIRFEAMQKDDPALKEK